MLNYILEMLVCQVLFLGLYQVFKSEPFFRLNRFYLLLSLIISMVLPFINFSQALPYSFSHTYVQWLQPLQIGGAVAEQSSTSIIQSLERPAGFQWNSYHLLYIIGSMSYVLWFMTRNRTVFHYLNLNSFEDYKTKALVIIPKSHLAFSFWDRIYLGADIPNTQREVILEHEYQHLKQRHSWDVMFVEILQWLLWFNPLIYLYKIQLRQIHEFEADQFVTISHSKTTYINTLLNQSFGSQNVSFINTFFNSSNLKNRIKMIQRTQTSNLKKLKYLLILPVMVLAVLVSCSQDEMIMSELPQENELSKEEMNEVLKVFFDDMFRSEPYIYEKLREKPSIKQLFNYYDVPLKQHYTQVEEAKAGFLISTLTHSPKFKIDKTYQQQILKEIEQFEALKKIHEYAQKRVKERKAYTEDIEIEDLGGEDTSVPYALIDHPPHPDICADVSGEALKKCTSDFISEHINKKFDISKFGDLDPDRYRISVQFTINNTGRISKVKARGATRELEIEAMNAVLSLPKFIPGEVDGQPVGVLYGLPINFIIK